ncbi:MAG: PepSY-associated TM helix domain-containing protein [Geopsychrobacter sp.]|nr:PepSY-associated TM helix domain-containing protein [Geopsychrobacter sp.]
MRRIHRICGLLLAVVVIFYALTGLLLNHRGLFNYFLLREKVVSQVPVSDPAILRTFIDTYKKQIQRSDDPTVIRIRKDKTIEFLYGSHGTTTYIIDPQRGTMEKIDKSPQQPWFWLNRLHKAFKTSNAWLWMADASALAIILVSISGLLMVRYRSREILLVTAGGLLLVLAALCA